MTAIHKVRSRTNRLLRQHDRALEIAQHTRLYEAIRDRDVVGAEQAFLDHAAHIAREREAAAIAAKRTAKDIVVAELREVSDETVEES